jgi:hypothetical protein
MKNAAEKKIKLLFTYTFIKEEYLVRIRKRKSKFLAHHDPKIATLLKTTKKKRKQKQKEGKPKIHRCNELK